MVTIGAAVGVAALCATYVVAPWANARAARETAYAASRDRWVRLETLVASASSVRRAVADEARADSASGALLSTGATPALAGSSLQVLLRSYAEQSAVLLDRIDVAGQPTPDKPGLVAIPVMIEGQGDIYGLVAFLFRMQHGTRLFVIDEMAVSRGPIFTGRDRLLTWSLRAHGLYPAPSAASAP